MAVFQATATATTTTGSATYALLSGMTLTPGAGDYILSFTGTTACTSESDIFFEVFINGVAVTHTERQFFAESSIADVDNHYQTQIYAYLPSVGVAEAVEIRWNRATAGTASCFERTLTLQEVDSLDVQQATATAGTNTTSSSDVLMGSMTLSAGSTGDYVAYFSSSLYGGSGADMRFSIYVNGVQQAHTERRQFQESSIADTAFIMGVVAGFSATVGQDVEIRWREEGGGDTINALERTLVLQEVPSYDQATATASTTTTDAAFNVMSGMTLTPGSGDYLAFFTTSAEGDGTDAQNNINIALYDNAVSIAHTARTATQEDSIPDTTLPLATHAYITGVGVAEAVDLRWSYPDDGDGIAWERTLVLIPAEVASSSSSSSTSSTSSSSNSSSSSSTSTSSCIPTIIEDIAVGSSSSSSVSSSTASGTVTWGHHTGVTEDYDEDFTGNTTGWTISGSPGNDNEIIYALSCNEIITFDAWNLGVGEAEILIDNYGTGSGPAPTIQYKTATTSAGLAAASWTVYNGVSFTSLGWVQIRLIHI